MRRQTLIVMVKEPRAGRVKTRLGREIGMTNAAWWYRHQLARTLRNLRDPRWSLVLAVSPDAAVANRCFPAGLERIPQGGGDLGQRMRNALIATPGPTLLIGSDIPGVTRTHIAKGFRTLGDARTVIGPAKDGGFWLVGLKHPAQAPQNLFTGTRWSHSETLADTLPSLPHPVARIDMLADVDTARDL